MDKLFKYFGIALISMLVGFVVGVLFIPETLANIMLTLFFVFMIILIICAIFSKRMRENKQIRFPMVYVYLFAFLEGIMFYPAFSHYLADLGIVLFINIILGSLVYFFILAKYSAKQETGTYSKWGSKLFIILIVLLIMMIVNIFLGIPIIWTLLSVVGIILFSLYVLYDIDQFKQMYEMGYIQDEQDYSIHVLNIFIDFVNILLDILDLVSDFK